VAQEKNETLLKKWLQSQEELIQNLIKCQLECCNPGNSNGVCSSSRKPRDENVSLPLDGAGDVAVKTPAAGLMPGNDMEQALNKCEASVVAAMTDLQTAVKDIRSSEADGKEAMMQKLSVLESFVEYEMKIRMETVTIKMAELKSMLTKVLKTPASSPARKAKAEPMPAAATPATLAL